MRTHPHARPRPDTGTTVTGDTPRTGAATPRRSATTPVRVVTPAAVAAWPLVTARVMPLGPSWTADSGVVHPAATPRGQSS